MKVTRRSDGLRLRLDPVESSILATLFTDLADALAADAFGTGDPIRDRLYPSAYADDESAAADFRSMTENGLRDERVQRARDCADDLSADDVQLDPESADRWIRALNDLRLVLGTRLGVAEDDDTDHQFGPEAQDWAVYHWLTWLQDSMVDALSR
ncbi:MAG: hypothetical protein QOE97_412 [Pseudonocardiales bacterium]|nr:hypothetical protein [Pseudonocardiales bacterium]